MIISLEGSRGSGKSTAGGYLKDILKGPLTVLPEQERLEWIKKNTPKVTKDLRQRSSLRHSTTFINCSKLLREVSLVRQYCISVNEFTKCNA